MWPREADGGFRGGNQQSGPTTSDMPEPFTDPSGDGMEWLCKPAASEDNVHGHFTGCQSEPLQGAAFADFSLREQTFAQLAEYTTVKLVQAANYWLRCF